MESLIKLVIMGTHHTTYSIRLNTSGLPCSRKELVATYFKVILVVTIPQKYGHRLNIVM